jgi:transcription antitermination factor NusG
MAHSTRPAVVIMDHPAEWLAVLRIVVGLYFVKSLITKMSIVLAGGVIPVPMVSERWLGTMPKIVAKQEEKTDEAPKLKINFNVSDRVKINEGTFENFEGEVDAINEASGRVSVIINIFGRPTPVELEH